jgi:hypothetical protein
MGMIGHPTNCDDATTASFDLVDEPHGESFLVAVIVKQQATSFATSDDAIDCAVVLQPRFAGHRRPKVAARCRTGIDILLKQSQHVTPETRA